jgi:hypothetical protein
VKLTALFLLSFSCIFAQQRHRVYFLPGQGADARLFSKLKLENADTSCIKLPVPDKNESLEHYSLRLISQIDTAKPFILCGVSMGGMCAVEISKIVSPQKLILISSAKTENEIPFRYKFQRTIPIYKLFGGKLLIRMAHVARNIVEPDYKKEKALFKKMLNEKQPLYMKRSVYCIVNWRNQTLIPGTYHLHGSRDHTLPYRKVKSADKIKGGSHMMVLTRPEEVSRWLNGIINN